MIKSLEKDKNKQDNIFSNWENLRKSLLNTVYEQENAINDLVDALIKNKYKQKTEKPELIFSFIGPASSGKAFLSEQLAEKMGKAFKIFDMSQYSTLEEGLDLYGTNNGNELIPEGELIVFIKKNPESVVFFEDIEKADNQVQLSLFNIFTNKELHLDFNNCIIIFSTTIGHTLYQDSNFNEYYKTDKIRSQSLLVNVLSNEKRVLLDSLINVFAPKFVSFLSKNTFVMFQNLSIRAIAKIGMKSINEMIDNFWEKTGIEININKPETFAIFLSLYLSPDMNAGIIKEKLPEILFEKIVSFTKKEKHIPSKIIFSFSQPAEKYLNNLLKKKSLEKEIIRNSEYLKLKWSENFDSNTLNLKIETVNLRRFLSNININEGKFPIMEISEISFKDIAGQNKVKENLKEIIKILKKPHLLEHFKIEMPKGMLLYGPSGVGKSLLVKAFTKEANLQYIKVSGSDLFDPFYLHSVYEKAKEYSPCIVILEKIDIKGIVDGVITGIPSDWLLSEFEAVKNYNVFTVATVNKKEEIDPEIIAQGKLEIHIEVPALDKEARRFYINKILEKPPFALIDIL